MYSYHMASDESQLFDFSQNINVHTPNFTVHQSESENRKAKPNGNGICRVCGDKAYVYNFNVLTCESCKAFFRRNATKKELPPCSFGNTCEITTTSRRSCQACRLRKCFQVGMKRNYIMSEEKLAERRRRLQRNTGQHLDKIKAENQHGREEMETGNNFHDVQSTSECHQGLQDGVDLEPDTRSTVQSISPVNNEPGPAWESDTMEITIRIPKRALLDILFNGADRVPHSINFLEHSIPVSDQEASSEVFSPGSLESATGKYSNSPREWSEMADSSGTLDIGALDSLAASMKIDHEPPILSPLSLCLYLKFAKLDELFEISEKLRRRVHPTFPMDIDIADVMYVSLYRLINGFGQISAFRQLPVQDQLSLLKFNFNEIGTVMQLYKADSGLKSIVVDGCTNQEFMPISLMKRIRGGAFYHGFKKLLASFPEKWRSDRPIMLILGVLAMFNPDIPNLINRDGVEAERRVYCQLLKDYLENKFGLEDSYFGYKYLMNWVNNLPSHSKKYCTTVYFELDPNSFDVLVFKVGDVA